MQYQYDKSAVLVMRMALPKIHHTYRCRRLPYPSEDDRHARQRRQNGCLRLDLRHHRPSGHLPYPSEGDRRDLEIAIININNKNKK